MKLYYSGASPYARKVRVVLREFGLSAEEVLTATAENDPEFIAANPLGKVPVLVTKEYGSIFDSQVICRYLDESFHQAQWKSNSLPEQIFEAACQGVLDEAVTMIMEKRRPKELVHSYWIERYRESIPRSLAWVWDRHRSSIEKGVGFGTITLACALDYLDYRHPEVPWRDQVPEMAEWVKSYQSRASFVETKPQ